MAIPTVSDKVILVDFSLTETNAFSLQEVDTQRQFSSTDKGTAFIGLKADEITNGMTVNISLANLDDNSRINRTLTVVTDDNFDAINKIFYYQMADDEILHWGKWIGYGKFTDGTTSKTWTGKKFKFSISRDITNDPATKLIVMDDVNAFMQSMDLIKGDMIAYNTRAENLLSGLENGSVKSNSKNVKPMKQMILFYGNPIEINDTMTVEKSARIYSKYDIVVFNGNIEEPNHSYHNNTKLIVARVKELNPTIEIFGYIHSHDPVLRDTGSSQPFLTIPEVDAKCKKWRDLIGATGIFLDAFGYDYWVTRTRQNELLDTVHANGMNAITNSWRVDYVFSKENYSFNNGLVQTNPNNVQIKLDGKFLHSES